MLFHRRGPINRPRKATIISSLCSATCRGGDLHPKRYLLVPSASPLSSASHQNDGVRGGGRPRLTYADVYTKSLPKKGDKLESILQSTETIDDRREFLGKFQRPKRKKATAGLSSHPHPSMISLLAVFRRSCSCFGLLPPRATVNRNIAMLPSYNSIPHLSTTNPTRARASCDRFLSVPFSVRNVSSSRGWLAGRSEDEKDHGLVGLGRPHDQDCIHRVGTLPW